MAWLVAGLTSSEPSRSARWVGRVWLILVFVGGGLAWAHFLNGGSIDFTRHDWIEAGHRYAFLQDAARQGVLPLHMPGEWALRNVTDRFWSVADTNLSLQIFLLRFMAIGRFVVANTLMLYAAGFVGLLAVGRRFRLSPLALTAIFLLLFFGGHIVAHLAVGQVHWAAWFLTPWFVWLVDEALHGPVHPWRWTLGLAAYLLVVLLQGGFHLFTMSVFFLVLLALSYRARAWHLLRAVLLAGLAGAVRLLPPMLHASEFDTAFLSGFTTVGELFEGLLRLIPPTPEFVFRDNPLNPLKWWEMDYYVGVLGVLFLAVFTVMAARKGGPESALWAKLVLPLAVMIALTIGRTYAIFDDFQVPLLSSQRVSSRLLFLPLSVFIVAGAIGFQRLLDRRSTPPIVKIALALGIVVLAHDLWTHFAAWRVVNMSAIFTSDPVDLILDVVANHPDPMYVGVLAAGALVSGAALAALGILAWREARPSRSPDGASPA